MKKRSRFAWWPKKKRPALDMRAFLAAAAAVFALLLVAFVLQQTVTPANPSAEKLPAPSFADFMPAGAQPTGATLELADLPQPAYVVAYAQGDVAGLALIAWSRDLQRYALASTLPLADGPAHLAKADALSLEPMGSGAQPVMLARGPSGGSVDGTFVLMREADGLRLARTIDESGKPGPAFFLTGQDDRSQAELALDDADSDGRKEAIVTRRTLDAHGSAGKPVVSVYRWSDGTLTFDKDLSWAMTVSQDIFPEPKQPAVKK